MSFRVQFTISDKEHDALIEQAAKAGYPNVAELCKSRSLQPLPGERKDYASLYRTMVDKIAALEPGKEFLLRDLIDTPPALLGTWLFKNVKSGVIPNVEHLGQDSTGTEKYRRKKDGEK